MLEPPVWHVDLYRLEQPDELAELGLDDAEEGILLVEWPEHAPSGLWREALHLTLSSEPQGARCLTAVLPPSWEARWPFR
jgi:tRNA threonylcarbamoyladenosine biosynthesis protein TsaE